MIQEINIREYVPQIKKELEKGKNIKLLITGSSMSPFLIHNRDIVFISRPTDAFYKGEIVFYTRASGQCVLHRIHHIDAQGNLYIVGDAQTEIEGPVKPEQVFGVVHQAIRKGKVLEKGTFWWCFFETVWIRCIPIRQMFITMYAKRRRK